MPSGQHLNGFNSLEILPRCVSQSGRSAILPKELSTEVVMLRGSVEDGSNTNRNQVKSLNEPLGNVAGRSLTTEHCV